MDSLKDLYFNPEFYTQVANKLHEVYPHFDIKALETKLSTEQSELELLKRMEHTAIQIHQIFENDYQKSIPYIYQFAPLLGSGFASLILPNYVQQFGQNYFDESMKLLKFLTPYSSSEFAVRIFLRQDFERAMQYMYDWSKDDNEHVRRLSSEGTRPRLPWSFKLDKVIENPELTFPILSNLSKDSKLYVKKSVGNHLNDITKDHADSALQLIATWDISNADTSWIIQRGLRTLIKKGDNKALSVLGFSSNIKVGVDHFQLDKSSIELNEHLVFSFTLQNKENEEQSINVDYAIHFVKKSGETNPKVFKLKTVLLTVGETITITKKHLFAQFTTRTHYAGTHQIDLLINGKNHGSLNFELKI